MAPASPSRRTLPWTLLAWLAPLLASGACGRSAPSSAREASAHSGAAIVTGTTVDALTGEVLPGVEITGPGGARTRSDEQGRFLLDELEVGSAGTLAARLPDGRRAENELRALRPGRLEVVLRLRKP